MVNMTYRLGIIRLVWLII